MGNRVSFKDLFEYDEDKTLILKRKVIIKGKTYEIRDELTDKTLGFFSNPEAYQYDINPLKKGDTLKGWVPTK